MTHRARTLTLALAALFGGASLAAAQQTTPGPHSSGGFKELEDGSAVYQPWNMTADQIEELNLIDAEGNSLGDIEGVLADASGKPVAIAAEVGGIAGIGDKGVVIGLDQLRVAGGAATTTLSKEQLMALPEWDD
jgi:hypothetical protein